MAPGDGFTSASETKRPSARETTLDVTTRTSPSASESAALSSAASEICARSSPGPTMGTPGKAITSSRSLHRTTGFPPEAFGTKHRSMRIAIIGGTGKEGGGLGIRWARAPLTMGPQAAPNPSALERARHTVILGSRDGDKARARAAELSAAGHGVFEGADNLAAAHAAEIVVLTV